MDKIYSVKAFSKTYGKRTILKHAGMELECGKTYAIVGANGSGKSTFAKVVAGIIRTDQGGSVLAEKEGGQKIKVGYLPQKPYAFRMSVKKNILLNRGQQKNAWQKGERYIREMGIERVLRSNAKDLSGGENAKMALARLLIQNYDILILDEPTAAMDIHSARHTEEILKQYQKDTGCCMIMVTHSLKQADRMAYMVCFFKDGLMMEYGKADQVLHQPQKQETRDFLDFYDL